MNADMGMVIPPWALSEQSGLLEAAVGESGLDRIVVPAVSGVVRSLRLSGGQPETFVSDAGWHYPADASRYANTRLKPRLARWFGGRHPLESAAQRAAQRGIRLTLRFDLLACASAQDWPAVRRKNAWGQERPDRAACPMNADLRQLLDDTLGELEQFDPAGYEIDDWCGALDGGAPPLTPLPLCNSLLDVCFCESCRQAALGAGVDAESAARSVRVGLEAALKDASSPGARRVADDAMIRAYRDVRGAQQRAWLERVAARHDARVRRCRLPAGSAPAGSATGSSRAGWAPLIEYTPGDRGTFERFPAALNVAFWRPGFADAAALVRFVRALADAGVSYVDFDGADESPPEALDWLRQALRYARRE
ncbi:MAG: hypothetical protein CHACPFDD_04122 [Phycisphaerae bacterium]|nr:hypothetical protein [Phycisphaerae bacterium]